MGKPIPNKIRCKKCKYCKVVGAGVAFCDRHKVFTRPNMQVEKCFVEREETIMADIPKKLIYESFSSHDCEAWYSCPYCRKKFGSYSLPPQKKEERIYCPHCKKEVRRGY